MKRQRHEPSRYMRVLILAAGACALMTACAALPAAHADDVVRIHVHNESRSGVDVTARINGELRSLGSVQKDDYPFFELELPAREPMEVIVVATSERDGQFETGAVMTVPGDVLLVFLSQRWDRSWWASR